MQVAFEDEYLESVFLSINSDLVIEGYDFTQRQLIKIINSFIALPNVSELSILNVDYLPSETEQYPHSVKLNSKLRLYFKQLAHDEILITNVE